MSASIKTNMTSIEGTTLGPGVECSQFRMSSGEQISLTGFGKNHEAANAGHRLRLSGGWSEVSKCMQGRTFRVLSIEKL